MCVVFRTFFCWLDACWEGSYVRFFRIFFCWLLGAISVFSAFFLLVTGAWAVHGRMLGRELCAFFPHFFLLVIVGYWCLSCTRTHAGKGAMRVFFRIFFCWLLVHGLYTDACWEGSYARFFRIFFCWLLGAISVFSAFFSVGYWCMGCTRTHAGKGAMRVFAAVFSVGYWCMGCTRTHAGKGAMRVFSAFFSVGYWCNGLYTDACWEGSYARFFRIIFFWLLVHGLYTDIHGRMLGRELCAFFPHFFCWLLVQWAVHGRLLGRELCAFFPHFFLLVTGA